MEKRVRKVKVRHFAKWKTTKLQRDEDERKVRKA